MTKKNIQQWFVKDLSVLTGVSVQTLHHYDRISLLKPSVRLSNGYRVYSEADLGRLQQIIALKFFGFELKHIQTLLLGHVDAFEHFSAQAQFLEQKAKTMLEASQTLQCILADVSDTKSIPFDTILKLIEVYKMTQKLEHSWVKEIFTPDELKQYATFETELKSKSTPEQKAVFEKNWADLVFELKCNLDKDPTSAIGVALGKKCMDWINGVYGKKYAHLRTKKFEKGFGEGKGLNEVGLTPDIVVWMEKAMDAYWRDRLYGILHQVGSGVSDEVILQLWNDALDDMYGEDASCKKEIHNVALADETISNAAKTWLRQLS